MPVYTPATITLPIKHISATWHITSAEVQTRKRETSIPFKTYASNFNQPCVKRIQKWAFSHQFLLCTHIIILCKDEAQIFSLT